MISMSNFTHQLHLPLNFLGYFFQYPNSNSPLNSPRPIKCLSCFLFPYRFLLGDLPQQIPHRRIPVSSSVSRGSILRNLPSKSTSLAMLRTGEIFVFFLFQMNAQKNDVSLKGLGFWFPSPVCLFSSWRLVTSIAQQTSFSSIHIKDEKPKENFGPLWCVGGNSISVLFLTQLLPFTVKL